MMDTEGPSPTVGAITPRQANQACIGKRAEHEQNKLGSSTFHVS